MPHRSAWVWCPCAGDGRSVEAALVGGGVAGRGGRVIGGRNDRLTVRVRNDGGMSTDSQQDDFLVVVADDGDHLIRARCAGVLPGGCPHLTTMAVPAADGPDGLQDCVEEDGWIYRPDRGWVCPYCRGVSDGAALAEALFHRPVPSDDVTRAVLRLEAHCAAQGGSLPDALREALEESERRCRTDRGRSLVDSRPSSWEADLIRQMIAAVEFE